MEDTKLILMFSVITLIAITYMFFKMALIYRLERVKNDLQDAKQKLQNVNDQIEANNKRIQELKSNIK